MNTIETVRLYLTLILIAALLFISSLAHAGFPDSAHLCLFVGNSNTEGYKSLPLIHTAAESPDATMFSIGPRIFPNGGGDFAALNPATLGPIVPIFEMEAPGYVAGWSLGETSASSFANYMANLGYPITVAVVGQANTTIPQVDRGSEIYANSLAVVRAFVAQRSGGWVDCILADIGETDALDGVDQATIEAEALALQSHYAADIAAITKQGRPPLFLTDQETTTGQPTAGQAQLAASWSNFSFRIVAPMYPFTFESDQFHMDAPSHDRFGEFAGRTFAAWLGLVSWQWPPLQAYSGDRLMAVPGTGAGFISSLVANNLQVQVNYYVPTPPIHWLAGASTHPPNRGFTFQDCLGNRIPVTGVDVIGPKNLMLTLATAPTCGGTVRYGVDVLGIQGLGGQGIVEDSAADLPNAALATITTVP